MAHTSDPSTWEAEVGRAEFQASLVYTVSFRTARTTTVRPLSWDGGVGVGEVLTERTLRHKVKNRHEVRL